MKHSLIEPLEARIAPAAFSISVVTAPTNEGAAGASHQVTFSVTLDANPASPISVQYHTLEGQETSAFDNATEGVDYTGTSGTLNFDSSTLTQSFTVTVIGDDIFEHTEKFGAMLTNPTGGATINVAKVFTSITNDDAAPVISIEDASAVEGNDASSPHQLEFKIKLSEATFENVTVTASTADGTATTGDNDYTATTMQFTFAPGETEKTFIVPIKGDTKVEADETMLVKLTANSANSTLPTATQATGTIISDELNLTIGDATKIEGGPGATGNDMAFFVKLQGATPGQVVTMNFATVDGTAVSTGANPDFQATSGTITLTADANGNATFTINVPIIGDALSEGDETFSVKLSNVTSGVTAVKGTAVGTITADDPSLVISPATVTEGNLNAAQPSQDMAFTLALDHAAPNTDIEIHYHTTHGTAVSTGTVQAGTLDYEEAVDKIITVHTDATGHVTDAIKVKIFGDGVTENNEFFNLVVDSANVKGTGVVVPIDPSTVKGTINDNDTTVLTIGNVTVVEGNSGQKQAIFVVTLTPSSQGSVSVSYATGSVGDTATAGEDYTTTSGTLTFAAGVTSKTIVVPILGDLTFEGNETFTVKLSNPSSGVSIANDVGVGTIQDNDPMPTISLAPVSVNEGDAGGVAQLSFVAKLSAPSKTPVTVTYTTQDGTAIAGSDYVAKTGTVTIPAGQLEAAILIDVTGDTVNEGNETINVQLSNPDGATLSPSGSTATGTILNDDITAHIETNVTVNEGAGTVTLTVTLDEGPVAGSTATVNFALVPDTAKLNSDVKLHDPAITSLVFNAGETSKTITLDIVNDLVSEGDETFNVTLTGAAGAAIETGNATGHVIIHDNDPLPKARILDAQITEGDSGTKDMTFKVTLSEASGQAVTLHAATLIDLAGGAGAGDFQAFTDQAITFAAGETEKTVTVKILGDTTDEHSETFKVVLSSTDSIPRVEIVDAEAVGTIADNDLRAISIADASVDEGGVGDVHTMKFTVSIAAGATLPVSVDYTTVDGTAKAGTNYTAKSGTLTFQPGEALTQTIEVLVSGNNTVGPDKTFAVALSNPDNATLADNKANGRIIDDESFYRLEALGGASIGEDTASVTFRVTRGGDRSLPGTVSFSTVDGTAHAGTGVGGDYLAKVGTLNFAAGETEKTVTVTVREDFAHELNEDFQFRLTGSTGGVFKDDANNVVATLSKTTTITDNDLAPTVSIASVSKAEGNQATANDPATTDFTFTVSLSAADEVNDVKVMYATIAGTGPTGALSTIDGTRPADFAGIAPTLLTIPKGSLSATFVVHVVRDTIMEGDETFTVKLSNPTGEVVNFAPGGDTATGTIENDDGAPTITFESNSLTVVEGNTGETPATFTVKLSAPSEQPVTITVGVVTPDPVTSTTAKSGTDFLETGVPTTLTFAPGETSKTLSYAIVGDVRHEANETFTVRLTNAQHGTFGSGNSTLQATATIKDDDATPALIIQNVSAVEGNAGETTNLVFEVTLAGESDLAVTVDYTTLDIGAFSSGTAPDYQAMSGTLTFAPGEHTKTISVPIIGDDFKEGDETFSVKLSNPTNATLPETSAIGTILEDGDAKIGVSVTDVQTVEGDSNGTKTAAFTVTLSGKSDTAVTVDVSTRNGTAVAGADYTAQTTTLTFAPNQTTQTFTVALKSDTVFEATESFFVDVKNPTGGAVLRDGEGRATIFNDDLQIVNAQTVRYVDADGDLATVHISKGALTTTGQSPVLNFSAVNAIGGRTLQLIDFTSNRITYNHTDLSVTADLQPGFSASGGTSDGRVDVGYIQGGIAIGSLFQIFDNIDLGNVVVEGDLGKIVAGDQIATDRAIVSLSILSHGAKGTGTTGIGTGAPDNISIFLGGATRISVAGDWNGSLESVGGDTGDIQSLTIKGALRGGSGENSGEVFVTGTLNNAVIGSIVGGSGKTSGTIIGNFTNDATLNSGAKIGRIHVLGDITGGSGASSGRIFAPNISAVTVDGDVTGGAGQSSGMIQVGIPQFGGALGSVVIKGDLKGGAGANSGEIFVSKNLGTAIVFGSLLGGAGADSGSIVSGGGINTVKVLKNIVGDAGERSGSVQAIKNLRNFQLGTPDDNDTGDLKGGKGASSGILTIGRNLTTAGIIYGSIEGGSGTSSGGVDAAGRIENLAIGGDVIGGSTNLIDVTEINTSGYISANQIGSVQIAGNIQSGTKADPSHKVAASGTIRVFGDITSLVIGKDIVGNVDVPVVIDAAGATLAAKNQTIGTLIVNGNTSFADILGGYGGEVSATNLLGKPVNPDAQMGTLVFKGSIEATNIVVGVDAGADGRFGTEDDQVITGGIADNAAVRSRIAAIIIRGEVKTNADAFGVVAQIIGAATIGNAPLNLNPTGLDDIELGTGTTNFSLHEVGLA